MLVRSALEDFNIALSSNSPAPGGGSVSALCGALGAELLSMVCNLSLGKKSLSEWQSLLEESLKEAQGLAGSLLILVDLDTDAFNKVIEAYKMPRTNKEECEARNTAIEFAYKESVQVPFNVADECLDILRLASHLIGRFNLKALSDFGIAALVSLAGLEGAALNVRINLPSIKDQDFVKSMAKKTANIIFEGRALQNNIHQYVKQNLISKGIKCTD